MSEIDDTIRRLVDEAEIRGVVDGIDLATDAKDWELCRSYFTGEIFADFTSLAGGESARMPSDDLVSTPRSSATTCARTTGSRSRETRPRSSPKATP